MRKKIVAGNWKMNLLQEEAPLLYENIIQGLNDNLKTEVVVFPPALYLSDLARIANPKVSIGAQNFYPAPKGAYTGEVSLSQMQSAGIQTFLIGHSERRAFFNEQDDFLKSKVDCAIANGAKVFFCCGEPKNIREEGKQQEYVKSQLINALFHLTEEELENVIIAYEPVWAIGTGLTASVEQAEEMHADIRSWIEKAYSPTAANKMAILYGGSCNATNAKELFACPNVDGGLIGGASLEADAFLKIANSF